VDLDVLDFGDPSPLPVQVYVRYDSIFTTNDMLADWERESAFSMIRVITTDPSDAPDYNPNAANEMEILKQILKDNKFVRHTGTYPGKRYKFLVSCPNQRCKNLGSHEWCCQECKKVLDLAVRRQEYLHQRICKLSAVSKLTRNDRPTE